MNHASQVNGLLFPAPTDQRTAADCGCCSDRPVFCQAPPVTRSLLGPDLSHRLRLDAVDGATRVARRRLLGTFFGVTIAAIQISLTPHGLISYALAIAILGVICGLIKLHSSAFRFGAIALTVVATSPDKAAVWLTAGTRFVDVALGILVALAVVRIWPKSEPDQDTIPTP